MSKCKKAVVSYTPEIIATGETEWSRCALRFGTCAEAEAYVRDLARRWTAVRETRVVECEEAPNYFVLGGRTVGLA